MEARRRSTIILCIIAVLAFLAHWPLDEYLCNPKTWPYRPPVEEGRTMADTIFVGGGGTPAIFAMLGGQRYLVGNILWQYSDVLFHDGKTFEMVKPLEATVTLNPSFLEAWSVYGWHLAWNLNSYVQDAVLKEKWRSAGEDIYMRAVQANKDRTRPYFDLAWLYIQRMSSYEKAIPYLEAVVYNTGQVPIKGWSKPLEVPKNFQPYTAAEKKRFMSGEGITEGMERKWIPEIYGHRLAYAYKKVGIIKGDKAYLQKAIDTYAKCLEIVPTDDAARNNMQELQAHLDDAAWLANERTEEDKHRKTYGMGGLESPTTAYYGEDRHDHGGGHEGHDR